MPVRQEPLVNDQIYHIFNRGVAQMDIFNNFYDYNRFLLSFQYYQNQDPSYKYSKFLSFSGNEKERMLKEAKQLKNFFIEIIAFCLMPNHFHFLVKQVADDGILIFMRTFLNSYAKYFNIKRKRKGPLFEGRFKAVRIENNEQLLHVNRYIHLNPYSGFIVKDFKSIFNYKFSSLKDYVGSECTVSCEKELILSQFKNSEDYKRFLLDQADYQRSLQYIKNQILE